MKTTLLCLAIAFTALVQTLVAQDSEMPLTRGDRVILTIGGIPADEVPQLSKIYPVSDSGTINLLHIGEVRAEGLKPSALQRSIENIYKSKEIYTNPIVTVSIDSPGDAQGRQVYVSGVNNPGPKPYKPGLTAMQAIMSGGGPTPYASLKKTRIVRTKNDGTRETIGADLSKYSSNPAVDVTLAPEDQIIVPE